MHIRYEPKLADMRPDPHPSFLECSEVSRHVTENNLSTRKTLAKMKSRGGGPQGRIQGTEKKLGFLAIWFEIVLGDDTNRRKHYIALPSILAF